MGTSVQNEVHERGCKTVSIPLPYHAVCGVSWTSLSICRWESSQYHLFTMIHALNELWLFDSCSAVKNTNAWNTPVSVSLMLSFVETVEIIFCGSFLIWTCKNSIQCFALVLVLDSYHCDCHKLKKVHVNAHRRKCLWKSPRCACEPMRIVQTTAMDHPEEGTMIQHRH